MEIHLWCKIVKWYYASYFYRLSVHFSMIFFLHLLAWNDQSHLVLLPLSLLSPFSFPYIFRFLDTKIWRNLKWSTNIYNSRRGTRRTQMMLFLWILATSLLEKSLLILFTMQVIFHRIFLIFFLHLWARNMCVYNFCRMSLLHD